MDLAETKECPSWRYKAHVALATTLQHQGAFPNALVHWNSARSLYDLVTHGGYVYSHGQELGVVCLATMAQTLWHLGYPDQALHRAQEALALARSAQHASTLAFALTFAGGVHQMRREPELAQGLLDEGIKLCADRGFAQWLALCSFINGWCSAYRDSDAASLDEMRRILENIESTGTVICRLRYLGQLAEACKTCGQVDAGLDIVTDALTRLQPDGDHFQEPELHRLQGELLLMAGESGGERSLRRAIAVARNQGAKSLELRATVSLVRALGPGESRTRALQMLSHIYHEFTEGFDTPDLIEAKHLLESLPHES
jgi:adenylate cyclase